MGGYNLQNCVEDLVVGNWVGDSDTEGNAAVAVVRGKSQTGLWVLEDGRVGFELSPS